MVNFFEYLLIARFNEILYLNRFKERLWLEARLQKTH